MEKYFQCNFFIFFCSTIFLKAKKGEQKKNWIFKEKKKNLLKMSWSVKILWRAYGSFWTIFFAIHFDKIVERKYIFSFLFSDFLRAELLWDFRWGIFCKQGMWGTSKGKVLRKNWRWVFDCIQRQNSWKQLRAIALFLDILFQQAKLYNLMQYNMFHQM